MRTVSEKSRDKIFSFISHVICTRNRGKQRCYWGPCGMLSRNKFYNSPIVNRFWKTTNLNYQFARKLWINFFWGLKSFSCIIILLALHAPSTPPPPPNKHPVGVKASITIRIPFAGRYLSILGLILWLLIILFYFHSTVLHVCSI